MTEPKDTRPLMIATPAELRAMNAREVLERLCDVLAGYVVVQQNLIDGLPAAASPADAAFQRGVKLGLETAAVLAGATLEHGFDR